MILTAIIFYVILTIITHKLIIRIIVPASGGRLFQTNHQRRHRFRNWTDVECTHI